LWGLMNQFERARQKAEKSRERRGLAPIDMTVTELPPPPPPKEKPKKSDADITVTVDLGDEQYAVRFRARNFRGNNSALAINEQGIRRIMREALVPKLGRIDDI